MSFVIWGMEFLTYLIHMWWYFPVIKNKKSTKTSIQNLWVSLTMNQEYQFYDGEQDIFLVKILLLAINTLDSWKIRKVHKSYEQYWHIDSENYTLYHYSSWWVWYPHLLCYYLISYQCHKVHCKWFIMYVDIKRRYSIICYVVAACNFVSCPYPWLLLWIPIFIRRYLCDPFQMFIFLYPI